MHQRGPGLFVSIEAGRSSDAEKTVRTVTRRVKSDMAQRQRRAGMRRVLMTTVFEARDRKRQEKFGAHIVAVMPNATARDRAIEGLNGSSAYADVAAGCFSESGRPVFAAPVQTGQGLRPICSRGDATGVVRGGQELSGASGFHPARASRWGSRHPLRRLEGRSCERRQGRAVPAHLCEAPAEGSGAARRARGPLP